MSPTRHPPAIALNNIRLSLRSTPAPWLCTDVLTTKAVEFLEHHKHDDRPFFLYLAPCERQQRSSAALLLGLLWGTANHNTAKARVGAGMSRLFTAQKSSSAGFRPACRCRPHAPPPSQAPHRQAGGPQGAPRPLVERKRREHRQKGGGGHHRQTAEPEGSFDLNVFLF